VLSPAVFPEIHQHVNERVPHCPRGGERPGMIPILPDGAPPAECAVDSSRYADREAPETAAECLRVVGLDDQMHVIVLHAELENPKPAVGGRGEGTVDGGKDPLGSQATDGEPRAKGDVQRVRGGVRRPGTVRDAGAAPWRGLPAGAGSPTTPGRWHGEEELQGARHVD
jgi:hypothetical protein